VPDNCSEGGNAGLCRQNWYRGRPEAVRHLALDLSLVDIHLGEHAFAGDHDVGPIQEGVQVE